MRVLRLIVPMGLAFSLLLSPPAGEAQQAASNPRVGFLSSSALSESRSQEFLGAFRQGLRELGYVEGQNITLETRWAEGNYDQLPGLAAELVRLKANVIVAFGSAIQPARQADRDDPYRHGGGS